MFQTCMQIFILCNKKYIWNNERMLVDCIFEQAMLFCLFHMFHKKHKF